MVVCQEAGEETCALSRNVHSGNTSVANHSTYHPTVPLTLTPIHFGKCFFPMGPYQASDVGPET